CPRCEYDRLIIHHIDSARGFLDHTIFDPRLEPNTAFSAVVLSWSPDGSRFAVLVGDQDIYIINRSAQVLQKISLSLKQDHQLDDLIWTSFGLVYLVDDFSAPLHPVNTEIYLLSLDDPRHPALVLSSYNDPYILSANPRAPQLLIESSVPVDQGYWAELEIFNLQTRGFEKIVFQEHSDYPRY
ncbi:MAG: hypothetical protein WCF84_06855, partial [Anaerolineae bacterium]